MKVIIKQTDRQTRTHPRTRTHTHTDPSVIKLKVDINDISVKVGRLPVSASQNPTLQKIIFGRYHTCTTQLITT